MREMDGLILRNDGGTAYNKAYLATCLRHFTQILLRRTSDTLKTLGEMAGYESYLREKEYKDN